MLRVALASRRADTVRVNRLNAAAFALRINRAELTLQLSKQALALAEKLQYDVGLLNASFSLGYYYRGRSQYDSAQYFTKQAMAIATRLHRPYDLTRGLYNLSRIYSEQGDYSKALAVNIEGLALAQALHNRKAELFQLIESGLIATALGEYEPARARFNEALLLAQSLHDYVGMGHAYSGLGDLNRQQMHWSLAGHYYSQSAESYRHVYNATGLLLIQLSVADMVDRQGDHLGAQATARRLLRQAQQAVLPSQVARAQLLLARTFMATGVLDSAYRYGRLSWTTMQRNGMRSDARDAAALLAQTNAQLGHWQEAYRFQQLTGSYTDSLTGEATRRRVAGLNEQATRSRRQARLRLGRQQTRLQMQQQELSDLRYRQQLLLLSGLVAVVAALGAGTLWYHRRREHHRLLALRTRIAADLHDEVGSVLTQISMQSTLLREGHHTSEQQRTYLDQMVDASRLAARQLSDAVWSIDARHDSAASLLDRLRDHAHEVLPPAGVELIITIDPTLTSVAMPLPVRQALYFIYKESLHNVVKHARAQHVWVRLWLVGGLLEMQVHDDGQGITTQLRPGGQGISNMRMRATTVGGTLLLAKAEASTGVQLLVRLPLRA